MPFLFTTPFDPQIIPVDWKWERIRVQRNLILDLVDFIKTSDTLTPLEREQGVGLYAGVERHPTEFLESR